MDISELYTERYRRTKCMTHKALVVSLCDSLGSLPSGRLKKPNGETSPIQSKLQFDINRKPDPRSSEPREKNPSYTTNAISRNRQTTSRSAATLVQPFVITLHHQEPTLATPLYRLNSTHLSYGYYDNEQAGNDQ